MHPSARSTVRFASAGVLVLGLGLAPALRLEAQAQLRAQSGDPRYIETQDGTPDLDLAARARGFRLFAGADLAAVGMHGVGNFATAVSNYGPCENNQILWNCLRIFNAAGTATSFVGFDMNLVLATPPSEWVKMRALVRQGSGSPLDSAKGGGYNVIQDFTLSSRPLMGADDGSLGRDFTGVLTTAGDGACTDNSINRNGFVASGLQMLPADNCPQSWVGGVFGGDNPINEDNWLSLASSQGASFNWKFWRVPASLKLTDRNLGNNFSTWGTISDHFLDVMKLYGAIVPGGTGSPQIEGYPLGIKIVFQAYDFGAPAIASSYIYQLLLINESQKVYGVGISYDSLYFALEHGMAFSGQANASYFNPQLSAFLSTGNGVTTACNGATNPAGNHGCVTGSNRGFAGGGGYAAIALQSPIGDLRNKLFTRPSSRFFGLGNPATYDDTIPFNIGHICGFGGCNANTHTVNDRRSYGVVTSHPVDVLDGRNPASLDASQFWRTFRNRQFPSQIPLFNTWVPGNQAGIGKWDWDNNGQQDTLYYDTCGGPLNMSGLGLPSVGCVANYADTMPGKQNDRYGNTGGIWGVGPFKLAAGDTTGVIVAFLGEPGPGPADSIRTLATIGSVIDAYLSFFLLPEAPPRPRIASSEVSRNSLTNANTVRIFFSDAPSTWVDPFLIKVASDMASATPGTVKNFSGQLFDVNRIRRFNPTVVATIRAAAADNFGVLEIYKSCNGGGAFDANNDCVGDPAVSNNGGQVGTGWRAYATVTRAVGGAAIATTFTDNSGLVPGQTYLYSLVTKSRGLRLTVLDSVPTGDPCGCGSGVVARQMVLVDSIQSALSRSTSDPQVVSVYIPASRNAGSSNASASVTPSTGTGVATVPTSVLFGGTVIPGSYTADFANKIIHIETKDGNGVITRDTVIVQDTVRGSIPPAAASNIAISSDTFVITNSAGVPFAGTPTSVSIDSVSSPPNRKTTRTFSALGFILYGPSPAKNPLMISTNLVGDAATPASIVNRTDYPGFTVSANNSVARTFASESSFGPAGEYINQNNINGVTGQAQWRQETSTIAAAGGGRYQFTYVSDTWGLSRGLVLNFNQPNLTEAELSAALQARPLGLTGRTDAATATLTGIAVASLAPVRVPFTITNTTYGRSVAVAMRARSSSGNTLLLGNGNDTIRVTVPANEWVPGDSLILIENVTRDSVVGGNVVLSAAGKPIQVTRDTITFRKAVVGCNSPRESCNPTRELTLGASGWVPYAAGTNMYMQYHVGYNRDSRYTLSVTGPVRGDSVTAVTDAQLDSIRVVPNPYLIFSTYQPDFNTARILFTHLPPRGTIRIYSVSGQFLQQITYTAANLNGTGDLYYDLNTREGTSLASGLYIWVLQACSNPYAVATNSGTCSGMTKRGKFVIIRGRAQ